MSFIGNVSARMFGTLAAVLGPHVLRTLDTDDSGYVNVNKRLEFTRLIPPLYYQCVQS